MKVGLFTTCIRATLGRHIHGINVKYRYFFETNSLEHISPSFISRTNFLYVEHDVVTSSLIFSKFIELGLLNIFSEYKEKLRILFETIYLEFVRKVKIELKDDVIIEINEIIQTMNLIRYLEMFFYEYCKQLLVNEKVTIRDFDFEMIKNVLFKFSLPIIIYRNSIKATKDTLQKSTI